MTTNKYMNIDLTMSNKCNFSCLYCSLGSELSKSQKKETIGYENSINFIDKLLKSLQFKEYTFKLSFWGGEPTLEYKTINKIIKYYEQEKRIVFFFFTNGSSSLFNIDWDYILSLTKSNNKSRFKVQFSYDGQPNHDKTRLTKHRQTTSALVKQNIGKFCELVKNNTNIDIFLKSTIEFDQLCNLYDAWYDIYQLAKKFNNNQNIYLNYLPTINLCVENIPDEIFNKYKEDFSQSMSKILKYIADNNLSDDYNIAWIKNKDKRICSMGKSLICVDVDGNIYACHNFHDFKKDLYISNIIDNSVVEKILKNINIYERAINIDTQPDKCKTCSSTFCLRCNTACLTTSKKELFLDKLVDYTSCKSHCEIFRNMHLYKYALQKYRKSKLIRNGEK